MPGLRLALLTAISSGLLFAQATLTTVRISTNPTGLKVTVDGTAYSQLTSMLWAPGSVHVLNAEIEQQNYNIGARYAFLGWMDSSGRQYGPANTITITADAAVWSYQAVFRVEYSLRLSFFQCGYSRAELCGTLPGTVSINGISYWKDAILWIEGGATIVAVAEANPGFAFAGWDNYFNSPQSPSQSFVLNTGWVLRPRFTLTAGVTVASSPPGLRVLVDGAPVVAPRAFAWAPGTGHTLAPVSPQQDAEEHYWWFDSWSDGGAAEHVFTPKAIQDEQTVTALYVPATIVTVLTEPTGLKVNVDGSDMWPSTNFIWGIGSAHTLAAPAEQADRTGRRYAFRGWTDGDLNATRQVTAAEGMRLVARYELLGRLTLESAPPGIAILADGAPCLTPCTFDRAAGTRLTITAPATSPLGDNSRLDFVNWQDQAARERTWSFTAEAQRIMATYRTMHRVRAVADPAGGALFRFDPPAADGFHAAGAQVLVTAEPQPGFAFRGWGGDLEGSALSGLLLVAQPRNVVAVLERVPYVAPAGVINAAGPTPVAAVAAGSIIAIYGANLAAGTVAGPASPLAQTLAGVTVQANGRWLPLLFVSPEQINALVPSDFAAGAHHLTVQTSGQPDVLAEFRVVRNAPGLFAAAVRPDGSVVSRAAPARPGEVITMFGTGFGPYAPSPLDGFAVPPEPEFPLVDPVLILAGDSVIAPRRVKAAPGLVGVTAMTFEVPGAMPAALKVSVNGQDSNTVALPVAP